ncbi:type II toxin-antitoxin system RelE/ParE family toxin [Spirosoma utsteinense]|uniref:Plasmid stabilization system protein ParE n=1 Tax=Spirosoma utsteinense TaxID=2585773 RepID=A0ABR6WE99_9BACT|nr:type II toxin-antitoxin system RelE/ParE family toxin [Spirosoma utsteinense]MBC3786941.1 plasmid stabilization system protein ParE [Spirosoma utsteinense]MBC3794321.1 plasmid stabilization system protein ParE [Spirosoma utsteinense]
MIVWKESASEDVRDICDYLFDQSIAVADELEKKLGLIAQFPEMGRIVPDFYISFIREVFVGRYRLVYSTQETTIKILAVRPMGRPLGKL